MKKFQNFFNFKNYIDTSRIIAFALDEADVMISQQGYQDKSILIHKFVI